jgi:eukaryotic-like serine/threonine-protein kinase
MDQAGAIITLQAGAYRLREPLAVSAYGVLWRAEGPPAVGQVALKLVNRERMERAGPALRGRWVDGAASEAAFLSALAPWDQRHIVRLLDSGVHEGLPALALELHDCDLGRHVLAARRDAQPLPLGQVLDWIAQANQALAKVHQYGFRYLDLKPGNLLLDARGHLKLADFGTIRPLACRRPHPYTGTARWQAPEQFFPGEDGAYVTDARTDYFALGALLYYLAAGQPLRFCTQCGEAFSGAGSAGGARLLARHGQAPSACLQPAEANRFLALVEQQAPGAGMSALALLRTLLSPRREGRPRHAVQVSRALAPIRDAARRALPMRHAA